MARNFFWYELMSDDPEASEAFYKAVVGWTPEPFPGREMSYIVLNAGERGVAGILPTPEEAKGMPAMWLGYIFSTDVDVDCAALLEAGGAVHRAPADIPTIGRFAVVADPQGAPFMLMAPQGSDQSPAAPGAPGHIGWRELCTADSAAALSFYAGQFGWTPGEIMSMDDMGPYRLFEVDGALTGAVMDLPPGETRPYWLFYFNVGDIDDAVRRVKEAGGEIVLEPMQVPDAWVLQARDPQGALFALIGTRG